MPLHPTKTCADCGKRITYGATRCQSCANRISKTRIRPRGPLESRYEIDSDSGCWVWTASKSTDGYGYIQVQGKLMPAHRHLYEMVRGPIPTGRSLDHLCRNRSCVNPAHLEVVDHATNMRRGIRTKLTTEQVREIRMTPRTETVAQIAARYGVSRSTINGIIHGRKWKDV